MMYASKSFALAGLVASLALPGFAQEAPTDTTPMTCAAFLALDSTAKFDAIVALRARADTSGTVGTSADATGTATAPAATTDGAGSSVTAEVPMTEGAAADESAVLTTEELVALTTTQCATQPDLLIADVQKANP